MRNLNGTWRLAAVAAVLLLQACTKQYENHILVARCMDAGDVYVREQVKVKSGPRGTSSSAEFGLYLDQGGKRLAIPVSPLGSYRTASADQLKVYRAPQQGDWQLYVPPDGVDAKSYEALASCLATRMDDIRRSMSISRPPRQFTSKQRALPYIATIRYANLADLQKRYGCEPAGLIEVQENGLIYLRRHNAVLIGTVSDAGQSIALDDSAVRYLGVQEDRGIADPLRFLRQCRSGSGASMFDDFQVSTVPNEIAWTKVERWRNYSTSPARSPSVTPTVNEASTARSARE